MLGAVSGLLILTRACVCPFCILNFQGVLINHGILHFTVNQTMIAWPSSAQAGIPVALGKTTEIFYRR